MTAARARHAGGSSRIALVTGANRGIGFEVAGQLGARGFHVVLTSRKREAALQAASVLTAGGLSAEALVLDVASTNGVTRAAEAFGKKHDRLDVLVNNAAILLDEGASVFDLQDSLLAATVDTNTIGALRVVRAFLPYLRKSDAARVINVSSEAGSLSQMSSYAPAYSISKAALNALTRQLAAAFAPDKIPVNSVCPGWVRTDMGGADAALSVEEGADTIVWLATDAPHRLTGGFFSERKPIPW